MQLAKICSSVSLEKPGVKFLRASGWQGQQRHWGWTWGVTGFHDMKDSEMLRYSNCVHIQIRDWNIYVSISIYGIYLSIWELFSVMLSFFFFLHFMSLIQGDKSSWLIAWMIDDSHNLPGHYYFKSSTVYKLM